MADKVKEYESEEIIVLWEAEKCIHSEKCFKGLPGVFDPNARPWVNVKGATDDAIKAQVDTCPSRALSYVSKNQNEEQMEVNDEQIVEVAKDGPLMVYGNIKVKGHDGTEVTKHRVTAFCRCGASENKPYCDGSHKKISFSG